MKNKVEQTVARGNVHPDEKWTHVFNIWDTQFTRSNHPTVIQVNFYISIRDFIYNMVHY